MILVAIKYAYLGTGVSVGERCVVGGVSCLVWGPQWPCAPLMGIESETAFADIRENASSVSGKFGGVAGVLHGVMTCCKMKHLAIERTQNLIVYNT